MDRTDFLKGLTTWPTSKELKISEKFMKKLGVNYIDQIFEVEKNQISYNKKILHGLTYTQKLVMKHFIENKDKVITYDEIAKIIFMKSEEFSLYAINKLIERLRKKLEINGITGAYIATMRGQGYMLRS